MPAVPSLEVKESSKSINNNEKMTTEKSSMEKDN